MDLCDGQHPAANAKGCVHNPSPQVGKSCEDGDPCSANDKCGLGKDAKTGAVIGVCKPGKGVCACKVDSDCKAKEDGDLCNGTLVCDAKTNNCAVDPATTVTCAVDDDEGGCLSATCDGKTGKCGSVAAKDDTACDDGDKCTQAEKCAKGKCDGKVVDCDDGKVCTKDACWPDKGCTYTDDDGAACGQDDKCVTGSACKAGACIKGKAKVCNDGSVCTVDGCDSKTGACTKTPVKAGTVCTDGSVCTKGDACTEGVCVPGKAVDCDDGIACTKDSCDKLKGCLYEVTDAAPCEDGDKCTEGDVCKGKVCIKGKAKVCDDGKTCTTDACDKVTGNCTTKAVTNGQLCNADNNVCTVKDACNSGKCVEGAAKVCNDGNACTDALCHPKLGCQFSPNAAPCDDGNKCTKGESCTGGTCKNAVPVACDDENKCTTDSCDPKAGCKFTQIQGCSTTAKTWTVLVYMAADNNLEPYAIEDVIEMSSAKPGENLRFVVQIDRHKGYSAKALSSAGDFTTTKRLVIETGKDGKRSILTVADLGETDTADPKHLIEFIKWGVGTYPSDHTALILWNHGQAWRGFGGDEDDAKAGTDTETWLSTANLKKALEDGLKATKLKAFDIVGFDACLMASLTTMGVVQNVATYLVASEDLEPAHGWNYKSFEAVVNNPALSPALVGEALLQGFANQAKDNKKGSSITLALLDVSKFSRWTTPSRR